MNAAVLKEITGSLSIFTVPALILFVHGKEAFREARFVHMDKFEEKVQRIYDGVFGNPS